MGFALLMLLRVLFGASMVFIIGYVFGGFSKKPGLTKWTKIATITVIVAFIAVNIILLRFAFSRGGGCHQTSVCEQPLK
ncbi:hypothetical protein [Chitinophaga nivalis]|uniref:Uncharacterized protein n=1 Tax=Chitinophaga nivalis TaxID=2991709 RepID=A0ABT3IP52_9BACT|nr:hypothetical protein [Chitinophaga nivalis]MCW3464553.1 hypothetical protein [Chitinophaga nivalis]MCW3485756.1 hypothetical protein [Chitinophaga nivalis]